MASFTLTGLRSGSKVHTVQGPSCSFFYFMCLFNQFKTNLKSNVAYVTLAAFELVSCVLETTQTTLCNMN